MKIAAKLAFALLAVGPFAASATQTINVVPTNWRMQAYVGTQVVLWRTGSSCNDGKLSLDPNDSGADRNKMLWATVLAARSAALPVLIEYDVSGSDCIIRSFGLEKQ